MPYAVLRKVLRVGEGGRIDRRTERTPRPRPMRRFSLPVIGLGILVGFVWLIVAWDASFKNSNTFVVYFGRPSDIGSYIASNWQSLIWASLYCLRTSIVSLLLAGCLATILLAVGLLSEGSLKILELLAAGSQVIPFLVIVTVSLLIERAMFGNLTTGIYSLAPVTVSLLFPPIVYGAKSIIGMQIQIKSLLRLWGASTWWRIRRVYIPQAVPDILTGLRTSATWAVGATLISDGLLDGVAVNDKTQGHLLSRPFSTTTLGQTLAVIIISTSLSFGVYVMFWGAQRIGERRLLGPVIHSEEAYSLQRG